MRRHRKPPGAKKWDHRPPHPTEVTWSSLSQNYPPPLPWEGPQSHVAKGGRMKNLHECKSGHMAHSSRISQTPNEGRSWTASRRVCRVYVCACMSLRVERGRHGLSVAPQGEQGPYFQSSRELGTRRELVWPEGAAQAQGEGEAEGTRGEARCCFGLLRMCPS